MLHAILEMGGKEDQDHLPVHVSPSHEDKDDDDGHFQGHDHGVGAGAFLEPDHEEGRHRDDDQRRGDVEESTDELTLGRLDVLKGTRGKMKRERYSEITEERNGVPRP